MNFVLRILRHLALWAICAVFLLLDSLQWCRKTFFGDFTTESLRKAFLAVVTVGFLVALVIQCHKDAKVPLPPKKVPIVAVVDGTAHPFRDTLLVYRDRVVHAPPDTVVKVLRRIVHDTVETSSDSEPPPQVCIPETTLRKATTRILTDSVKAYDDSVRHHYDSLQIRDLQNTPPDTVIRQVPQESFFSRLGKTVTVLVIGGLIGGGATLVMTH